MKRVFIKIVQFFKWLIISLVFLFVMIILIIKSSYGQNLIKEKLTVFVTSKIDTKFELEKIYLSFSGDLVLENLYLEDQQKDTLVYSKKLAVKVSLLPILTQKTISISSVNWQGLTAYAYQKEKQKEYNFDYIVNAFASTNKPPKPKEKKSEAYQIKIGKIKLKSINLSFNDEVLGVDTQLKLKELQVAFGKKLDLNTLQIPIKKFYLSDVVFDYQQNKEFKSKEKPSNTTVSPLITVDELGIKNTKVRYQNKTNKTDASVLLGTFTTSDVLLDLLKKNIVVKSIALDKTSLKASMLNTADKKTITTKKEPNKTSDFNWPDWKASLEELNINSVDIALKNGTNKTIKNVFNPQNIHIRKAAVALKNAALTDKKISFQLNNFSFKEQSGLHLKSLVLIAEVTKNKIKIPTFRIQTSNNILNSEMEFSFASINDVFKNPKNLKGRLAIDKSVLNIKDAFYFSPDLQKNSSLVNLSKKEIQTQLSLAGSADSLAIKNLKLQTAKHTFVQTKGWIANFVNPEKLRFNLLELNAKTQRNELVKWIEEDSLGIRFPEAIALNGCAKGSSKKLNTNLTLKTTEGAVGIKGILKNATEKSFNGDVNIESLQLGKILKNPKLGLIDFTNQIQVSGNSLSSLQANIQTQFRQLEYANYNYDALKIETNIQKGKGQISLFYQDENLDLDTQTQVDLDSVSSKVTTEINVKGINLQGLNLTTKNTRARILLKGALQSNSKGISINANTQNGLLLHNQKSIPFSNFNIKANLLKDTTSASIESDFLNFSLNANTHQQKAVTAMSTYFSSLFTENPKKRDTLNVVQINASFSLRQSPLLNDYFLEGLEEFEPINFDFYFDDAQQKVKANFNIPRIAYQGSQLNQAQFAINSTQDNFKLNFRLRDVSYQPISIQNLSLLGAIEKGKIHLDLFTTQDTQKIINIQSEIYKDPKGLHVHIDPSSLILDKEPWQVSPTNEMVFSKENTEIKDLKLFRNKESVEVATSENENAINELFVDFKQFDLKNILSFLNTETLIASGKLSGIVKNKTQQKNLTSDLKIQNLNVLENPLGDITINAQSKENKQVQVDVQLRNKEEVNLQVAGKYNANDNENPLNLQVDLHKLGLKTVAMFAETYISNPSGYLSAHFDMKGSFDNPVYDGELKFHQTKLKVNAFNTNFSLPEETIKIDNSKIVLNQFKILDNNQQDFLLDGLVKTDDLSNPKFDVQLKTKGLQVLNSTEKDNDLYYGKLFLDTDISIGGDLNVPKINGNLKINADTDFTYVIPEATVEAVERDGVVLFVNKKVTNSVLKPKNKAKSKTPKVLKGIEIASVLEIDKNAVLQVVVDKKTGDHLKLQGTANLNFGMNANGRTTLSGKYEVQDGYYKASLYNLVKRTFNIAKGSSITWQGDPVDAKMDLRAIYKVQASASGLMASVTSGLETSELNQYRRKVPFWVYLNLGGDLLKPNLSFDIDIPEDAKATLGGEVYTQVQQLNKREEELNKQVFSLLVLNQFFPSSSSDGSNGGSLSIARNNVNKVLSNQLNTYSNKLVGNTGIELGFELDSYTDYTEQGEQNNTQLNVSAQKRLFNDRLTVQVGSGFEIENNAAANQEKTPIIGNVKIEYALTENRRYRLKGFRKNEFESVIDGQVIATGISLLFNREFNQFKELFANTTQDIKKEKDEE
ncbi:translocation/assembly module TamB domain-containing protein [Ochrovirga pacifica]|uniref:translocation/assembly module TamB domain-containing protein n=1 Tax=Ochrovirga pacifica TaxID=1042376 RepID=UPI000255983D|nr:translocation/assembly module TamB domain-containing protein [Ochrovirga pacifica]